MINFFNVFSDVLGDFFFIPMSGPMYTNNLCCLFFRDISQLHFDPTKDEHSQLEIKTDPKDKKEK